MRAQNRNGILIGPAFAQMTAQCPYTLQLAAPPTSKLPFPWRMWTPISLGHPSPQSKRHLDLFSRFAGLTNVTDRPTDGQTDRQTTLLGR